jgi:hypothetical protein
MEGKGRNGGKKRAKGCQRYRRERGELLTASANRPAAREGRDWQISGRKAKEGGATLISRSVDRLSGGGFYTSRTSPQKSRKAV